MSPAYLIPIAIIFILVHAEQADAAPNKFISLVRSETCVLTDCIPVGDMIRHDNSTQSISGRFVYDSSGVIREKGMQNSHNYYSIYSGKLFVFAEPDQSTISRSKIITIIPTLPPYVTQENQVKYEIDFHTDKRIIQYGMWFDEKCHTGMIGADNGDLAEAIRYMAAGCTGTISNTEEITTKKTSRDVCLTQCQYEKWLRDAKERSKSTILINSETMLRNMVPTHHTIFLIG